jgi:hypothetical protein
MREQCSACGAAMACDQRYCVECGERRGPARVPALTERAPSAREAPSASPSPRRARVPLNSTLLAGIGTLLLAMGVGVLIGRSGASTSAKPPPAQVVTIAGGAGAAGTSTAPSTSPAGTATTAKPGGATGAAGAAGAGGGKSASQTHAKAPPKAVKVGSPGKGAGYQHGHFTGNFFGPESG